VGKKRALSVYGGRYNSSIAPDSLPKTWQENFSEAELKESKSKEEPRLKIELDR
jgi:hypothetical protein